MSRASNLIDRIEEIGYYGQHDDYGDKDKDKDAKEYMAPFDDLELPDKKSKESGDRQMASRGTKSTGSGEKVK